MAVTFAGGWQRMKGLFSFGGLGNKDEGAQHSGPMSSANESGITYTDDRALQASTVYSCLRLTTETVGSLPLGVFEKTDTGRVKVTDHFLYRIFRESPNAMMTPMQFREAMTANLCFRGNAYARIQWQGKPLESDVISLIPLRSDCMTPVRSGVTVSYHYAVEGGVHVFAKENILHIKGWGFDGLVGVSPIAYMAQTLGVAISVEKHAASAFSRGARPVGLLTTDNILTPDQRKQLREIYKNVNADTSDGTWVLEAGLKYQAISLSPEDLQMLESRKFSISELARFFLIPPHMIGDVEKSTSWGTGIEQQKLGFLTFTINPYLTRWEDAVSNALLSRTDRRKYYIEHNVEGLLRADSETRARVNASNVQNGLKTRNEVRAKENDPPMPGGDDLTVQVNLTPADQLPKVADNARIQNQPR